MGDRQHTKTGAEAFDRRRRQTFRHDVDKLFTCWNVEDAQFAQLNSFSDKMNVELNVLGVLVVNGIRGLVYCGYVVAEHNRRLVDATMEFAEQLSQPNAFRGCVRHRPILGLRA